MKTNRIRWLIPLFLFFGVLFFCSLTAYAAPTAPTSVSLKIQKGAATVTEAARGSKITLVADKITGGSGGDGRRFEYSFTYKSPSSSSYATIRDYSSNSSVDFTLSESGTYIFRVLARVADNSGVSPAVSQNANIKSVGVSNTSTISSSAVNLGENVTINASATGGTQYEYTYKAIKDGGSDYFPLSPSTKLNEYVASASCTYTPFANGDYIISVTAKDKDTGASDEKVFTVTASTASLINKCDVSSNNINITSKGQGVTLSFNAEKGKAPYQYRCSYRIVNGNNTDTYVYGDASSFVSGKSSMQYVFTAIGTYKFTFEVQDSSTPSPKVSVTKTVDVRTNLTNTSTISGQKLNNRQSVSFNGSATGGTGEYEYRYSYQFDGGKEKISADYSNNAVDGWDLPNLISAENLDKNYTGTITFRVYVRDKNLDVFKDGKVGKVTREKKFDVTITEALATDISRQQLTDLFVKVNDWEASLSNTQRDNLNGGGHSNYTQARDSAYNAILSNVVQDYGVYYFSLMNEWENVRYDDLGDQFWMTKEVNNAAAFEDSLIKSIGSWFSSFSGVNIDTGTFSFNMESFVNQFSQIFVIFASSLLVLLFGINIIKTAIEYQLFTLKGAVTLFGRLFLAEVWIQLSTKICIMIVKIFNELMGSIIAALNVSGLLKTSSITFTAHRSGIYMVGEIVDFLQNLCPFLLIMLLIGAIIIVFVVVYIKLIIRSLELGMLSVVSPVFFACSVGEATMPYFRKFLSAFLSVSAEIIFMALVYMAFLWYCKETTLTPILLEDLYKLSSPSAASFYTYIAVTVACGIMMIRPPQVLKDLVRA